MFQRSGRLHKSSLHHHSLETTRRRADTHCSIIYMQRSAQHSLAVWHSGKRTGFEHKTEVKATTKKPFTRGQGLHSLSEQNKSALTDHASRDNHTINWPQATILDRESDRGTRWIKEAVHIRKEGRSSMNRDEGSYTLSHTYDRFLATSHDYRGKNQKKN